VKLRRLRVACLLALLATLTGSAPLVAADKPNIVMIAIDDQNDWIGCLGGHPLVKTPNIDNLASSGTLMRNAHCQAPLCNPSRTSLMFSLRPSTTGIYGLSPWIRKLPDWRDRVSLPQYFAKHGYHTLSAGKIHHSARGPNKDEPQGPEFAEWGPSGRVGAKPPTKLVGPTPMGNNPLVDWGVWPPNNDDTSKGDYQVASWAVEKIRTLPNDKPFFLAAGFFLPHVPCYATQKWFDLYPTNDKILPELLENDRDDTPRFSWYLHWSLPEPRLRWLREAEQWHKLVHSYLASTSFVDSQVGRLLSALRETGHDRDTIVVLWSDHGWHLGEKGITGKNTLWDRSTHVPLIFAGPGVTPRRVCEAPAELLDIYPTLVELAGLPPRDDLEGHSVAPQLRDHLASREWPAITTHNQGNHGIRTERWRYIRYADGSQELYDLKNDPREWNNLAGKPEHVEQIKELAVWIPKKDVPPAEGSASRILTYFDQQPVWEGKPIKADDLIPE